MVGYEPCQKHVRTFSPSMTPKLERLSLTETAHNYRLGERLRLRLMVALLTLVGKCLCRRENLLASDVIYQIRHADIASSLPRPDRQRRGQLDWW